MSRFRCCIDLHAGVVKQVVGGSLRDQDASGGSDAPSVQENFVSDRPAQWFSELYLADGVTGSHVIKLGPGNDEAARAALAGWPNGLQIGGGITSANAREWLDAGASHVIVTSFLFDGGCFSRERLAELSAVLKPEELVIDLSCRRRASGWYVTTDRWQTITETEVTAELLQELSQYCAEFLVHAADVEGQCGGIDTELVRLLGEHCPIPCTYAGGAHSIDDLAMVEQLSAGKVDLTYGSALDIFGGTLVKYADCIAWNARRA